MRNAESCRQVADNIDRATKDLNYLMAKAVELGLIVDVRTHVILVEHALSAVPDVLPSVITRVSAPLASLPPKA